MKKRIDELKIGDRVKTDAGTFTVQRIARVPIFEPQPYEVFVDGGESAGAYGGSQEVEIEA